jgi:hypothetical protein
MGGLSRFPQSIKQTGIRNLQIIYRLYVQKVSENVDQCQHGKLVIKEYLVKNTLMWNLGHQF